LLSKTERDGYRFEKKDNLTCDRGAGRGCCRRYVLDINADIKLGE